MLVVWQYRHAFSHASQDVQSPGQLDALLRVLDQRAAAGGYPHAVLLAAGAARPRTPGGPAEQGAVGGQGPQPELTLVVGAADAPMLWWDSLPAARQISVGPRAVPQPEPPDFFTYYSAGQQRHAPESSLVSRDDSWRAARLFLTSGGHRPVIITWRTPALASSSRVSACGPAHSAPDVAGEGQEPRFPAPGPTVEAAVVTQAGRPGAGATGRHARPPVSATSAGPDGPVRPGPSGFGAGAASPARSVARPSGHVWRPWPLTS